MNTKLFYTITLQSTAYVLKVKLLRLHYQLVTVSFFLLWRLASMTEDGISFDTACIFKICEEQGLVKKLSSFSNFLPINRMFSCNFEVTIFSIITISPLVILTQLSDLLIFNINFSVFHPVK